MRIDEIAAEKISQYDHEIPDISSSLTVMNSITKKQIGLFTRRRKTIIFCIRRGTENDNSKGNTG